MEKILLLFFISFVSCKRLELKHFESDRCDCGGIYKREGDYWVFQNCFSCDTTTNYNTDSLVKEIVKIY